MTLTLALGYGSVRETMDTIDSAEFALWQAYDRLSPMGGERLDYLAATIAFSASIGHVDAKTARRLSVQDFIPKWNRSAETTEPKWKILKQKLESMSPSRAGRESDSGKSQVAQQIEFMKRMAERGRKMAAEYEESSAKEGS